MGDGGTAGRPAGGDPPYTGDVTSGGPADVRELSQVVIRKVSVSAMDNNAFLLTCRATGAQVLIDAADDAPRLLRLVAEGSQQRRLDLVITTHRHWDHVRALGDVLAATGADSAAGAADADALPVPPTRRLRHGEQVTVGALTLQVVGLRGHTPGSVAVVYDDPGGQPHLFSGDSLFPGGVGATEGDPERFRQLLADVQSRVFDILTDETWIYPGHGRDTTVGSERPHLPEWRARGW